MTQMAMLLGTTFLVVLTFLSLWRAALGPSVTDRVAAINMVGTKAIVIMVMVGYMSDQRFFIDVAMVYALIAFLMSVGMAKYLERGKLD